MDRQKEVAAIIGEVVPRLEALADDAMREIREAEEVATKNISAHERVSQELVEVESEITRLRAEREQMPILHSRAVLDDAVDEELRLKDRAAEVRTEIERLEQRREALRVELHKLSPRDSGYSADATIHQYGQVAGRAYRARIELEELHDALTKSLSEMLDPVTAKHESMRSTVWQLGHERDWAERGTRV